MKNYILKCGNRRYEVTQKIQRVLEGVMYWVHCERLDRAELAAKEKDSRYSADEIQKLRHEVEQAHLSIGDAMGAMERLGIPNWVGNGAMQWARTHDLRQHYFSEFFTLSVYAAKEG